MTEFKKKVWIAVLTVIGAIATLVLVPMSLYYIFPHFLPFLIAYLFALILEPINKWIVKHTKLNRPIAVNITYFLFVGVIGLLVYFIITKITSEMIGLIKFIQKNIPSIQAWFLNLEKQIQDFILLLPYEIGIEINETFSRFVKGLASLDLLSNIGTYTVNITTAIPNYFIILLLMLISLYLISLNLSNINKRFYSYFKASSKEKLDIILKDLQTATVGFMQAQFILSSITYMISLVALSFLGVKYSLAIALLIIIVDILPILGTGSVLVPWAVFSFTQGNTFLSIGLVGLFVFIIVVRRIIEPKILGERIGLSPLITLVSIWVGFKVLGILGIFIGPLLFILYNALKKAKVINYKLKI